METIVTEDGEVRVVIDFFSVIYSADWDPRYGRASNYAPPKVRTLWQLTEGNENAEYTYDNMPFTCHRKWCAILSPAQFDEFINRVGLCAEDCETMGSLGAPGFGMGWVPAISFNGDNDPHAILNAYVTPVPKGDVPESEEESEREWEVVRRQIIDQYE